MKKQSYIYAALCVIFMAILSLAYFYPDAIDGRVLEQHDIRQGLANGQEAKAFHEKTGETTRWTNSLFSGMPTFQISPSYASAPLLNWIAKAYSLWLPSPANLLFIMMTGFFIMGLCLKMRWYVALFGAIAWAFSTYFIIIIGAGHIWKFVTLAYIPPTLGGIFLCYRGKWLGGTALCALFGALQLMSNHIQMSYYFMFVVAAIVIAAAVHAGKNKEWKKWCISTLCILAGGIIAVAANCASLYNTAQYAKETVRGKATELTQPGQAAAEGADFDYITAWSYGGDESLTLIVPNAKGGASLKPVGAENQRLGVMETKAAQKSELNEQEAQFANQFTQYFGNQPMTNGPVYVGIIIFMLALIAIPLYKRSPLMWALWAVTVLAWLLALGHNLEWFSRLFVDYFPGYNKFRTVSSILVIVEFTLPVLAMMSVKRIIEICSENDKDPRKEQETSSLTKLVLGFSGALTAICVILALFPSIMGSGLTLQETDSLTQADVLDDPLYSPVINEIKRLRHALVSADAIRSAIYMAIGGAIIWLYTKKKIKQPAVFVCALTIVCLFDLFSVDKRYVNSENFVTPLPADESFEMTDADRKILADPDPDFRVMDMDDFGGARSSYFHKTIGGYHAAKLTRYSDLITSQIQKNNMNVLNMLNAKYFLYMARNEQGQIMGDQEGNPIWQAERNPDALGNAWWIDGIKYVADANAEMAELDSLDTRHYAVADKKFESTLGKTAPADSTGTIKLASYAPNKLAYKSKSSTGGIAVFSEIYFPWGWKATIDGKEVPIGRVNYVLRALKVPAGNHDILFEFNPHSLQVTDDISVAAVVLIYLLCAGALGLGVYRVLPRKKEAEKQ